MDKFGLVGKNISYSYSPLIHQWLIKYYNINGTYELIDIDVLKNLDIEKYKGLNITIPYKEQFQKYITNIFSNIEFDSTVDKIGVTNTFFKENNFNKYQLFNTDIIGFDKIFRDLNIQEQQKIAILGTGGVSKMLVYYFQENHPQHKVYIVSRNYEKSSNYINYENLQDLEIDVYINTTPLGQGNYEKINPLEKVNLQMKDIIIDFNYNPLHSKMILDAKKKGVKTINGIEILILQAIASFEVWNKIKVENKISKKLIRYTKHQISQKYIVYGMPLAGKTTLYKKLAKDKNFENVFLIDLDEEISKQFEIEPYITKFGIENFRQLEKKFLKNLILENENKKMQILFLGGGTMMNKQILDYLKNYHLLNLNISEKTLKKRMNFGEMAKRPLLNDENSLQKIINQRGKYYQNIADYNFSDSILLEEFLNENFNN